MRYSQLLIVGLATTVGLISLSVLSAQSPAQTTGATTAAQGKAQGLPCNGTRVLDPFKSTLAGPALPPGLLPIDETVRDNILKSGLPCQENVSTGAQADPTGKETTGLENLQRGFDFYSWRTFIALNSPADGTPIEHAQADMGTRWEEMDNFKQLLDVMLPSEPAATEMANRQGWDGSRAREVDAGGMPRTASAHAQENDREDDRGKLQ